MTYPRNIIEAFGGVRAMATALGRPVSTVHSWGDRGAIPDEAKPGIYETARNMGLGLTFADFFPVHLVADDAAPDQSRDVA